MRKTTTAVDRTERIRSPIGELARQRRFNIAYRTYVLKALRRFDLEGKSESTPQHRARMSDQAELVTALGKDAPDVPGPRWPQAC